MPTSRVTRLSRLSPRTASSSCLPALPPSLRPHLFSVLHAIFHRDIWPNHLPPPVSRSTEHVRVLAWCVFISIVQLEKCLNRAGAAPIVNRRSTTFFPALFSRAGLMGALRRREKRNTTVVGCLKKAAFALDVVPSLVKVNGF